MLEGLQQRPKHVAEVIGLRPFRAPPLLPGFTLGASKITRIVLLEASTLLVWFVHCEFRLTR